MKKRRDKPVCENIKIIQCENNWKRRKFKEVARITLHKKEQLMNKKRGT